MEILENLLRSFDINLVNSVILLLMLFLFYRAFGLKKLNK